MSEWLRTLTTKQANASLHRKTVKNIVGLLNVILEWAREQRYLANDPLAAYRRQARKRRKAAAAPAREVRHLEPAELHALLNAAADDTVAEIILYLAAYSGVRRGELLRCSGATSTRRRRS